MREDKMKIMITSALFLGLAVAITICIPYMEKLSQPKVQLQFRQWVPENKFYGIVGSTNIADCDCCYSRRACGNHCRSGIRNS